MQFTLWGAMAMALTAAMTADAAEGYPSAEITNGVVKARIYLPQAKTGFYQGTRFDWSGVIYSLEAHGHNYYGPWFNKTDPSVHDFVYRDRDIVAGLCSAITGPVDEFGPLGYDEAKPGETFVKIGVGALRKVADEKYDNYHLYEIADAGKWGVLAGREDVKFTQELHDRASGYGYTYEKDLRLPSGKAEMVMTHRLKNVGKRPLETTVYNHNFLVLDQQPPGPGVTISLPFAIQTAAPPDGELAKMAGSEIVYLKTLAQEDKVAMPIEGFKQDASDSRIKIENSRVGAGLSWQTDRPLLRESLWSIRTVIAMEPFISITIEPGAEFSWQTVYGYYTIPKKVE